MLVLAANRGDLSLLRSLQEDSHFIPRGPWRLITGFANGGKLDVCYPTTNFREACSTFPPGMQLHGASRAVLVGTFVAVSPELRVGDLIVGTELEADGERKSVRADPGFSAEMFAAIQRAITAIPWGWLPMPQVLYSKGISAVEGALPSESTSLLASSRVNHIDSGYYWVAESLQQENIPWTICGIIGSTTSVPQIPASDAPRLAKALAAAAVVDLAARQ